MNYNSLNVYNLIKGKIGNIFNVLFAKDRILTGPPEGYELIKDLTPHYTSKKGRVGIYNDQHGKKVILKRSTFTIEDLDTMYLHNEGFVLNAFLESKTRSKVYPRIIELIRKKNELLLVTEYIEGKELETFGKSKQNVIVKRVMEELVALSSDLKKNNFKNLPVRYPHYYFLTFPFNLIRVILKNPSQVFWYLKLGFLFYHHYFLGNLEKNDLGFVHRDMGSENILYSSRDDRVLLVDWESAIVSDSFYDLTQLCILYEKNFSFGDFMQMINAYVHTPLEKRRFIGLAIFNSVQRMLIHSSDVFDTTENFTRFLVKEVSPVLLQKITLFEWIYIATLRCIYLFYKTTRLSIYSTNKKIVLCYHSVKNTSWRFSTNVNMFQKQVSFLQKNYHVTSLKNLIQGNDNGVAITFDDGYEDVLENALPVLEAANIPATLFVLGNPELANRKELDNNLPLIMTNRVDSLIEKGWTIGFHTKTHANLTELSEEGLQEEIVEGKKNFEKIMHSSLEYFAYPRGLYSKKVVSFVKKAGFLAAFTVDGGEIGENHLLLNRIALEGKLSIREFKALLSPAGIGVSKLFMKILTIKEKLAQSMSI